MASVSLHSHIMVVTIEKLYVVAVYLMTRDNVYGCVMSKMCSCILIWIAVECKVATTFT